jgi:hypothetical protein
VGQKKIGRVMNPPLQKNGGATVSVAELASGTLAPPIWKINFHP